MDRPLHSVKISTSGGITQVLLDDVPVKGCTHANLDWGVDQIPLVVLHIQSPDIQVDVDEAMCVEEKKNG